jgi:hypothetical protein
VTLVASLLATHRNIDPATRRCLAIALVLPSPAHVPQETNDDRGGRLADIDYDIFQKLAELRCAFDVPIECEDGWLRMRAAEISFWPRITASFGSKQRAYVYKRGVELPPYALESDAPSPLSDDEARFMSFLRCGNAMLACIGYEAARDINKLFCNHLIIVPNELTGFHVCADGWDAFTYHDIDAHPRLIGARRAQLIVTSESGRAEDWTHRAVQRDGSAAVHE